MYYQIAQLSYSGLLLLIQVIFLVAIKRRSHISSQVFQEPQQVKQSEILNQKDIPRKSSIVLSPKNRQSVQQVRNSFMKVEGKDDLVTQSFGVNSNHQQIGMTTKEQQIENNKNESSCDTILQMQTLKAKSQNDNPESQRDPLEKLIVGGGTQIEKPDLMIQLTYYVERIGFEQGLILLLWNFDLDFYIFIPISLFVGVLLRFQEKLGYLTIQLILLILIHGLIVLEIYLLQTNEYETFCYLIVFGVETMFSIITIILYKKCQ